MTTHKLEQSPDWIAIDWGTTSFRAWAMRGARVLGQISSDAGLLSVRTRFGQSISANSFEAVLREQIDAWLEQCTPNTLILMCGMVGSRQGWREAPYVACPASLDALTAGLCAVELAGFQARIVPGLSVSINRAFDVMRGEETQLLGLVENLGESLPETLRCIMPGTHSKHVAFAKQRVEHFRTYFSGELYQWLASQSLLSASVDSEAPFNTEIFREAVIRGARKSTNAGALLNELFATRARGLLGALTSAHTATWISGLVLGHELAEVEHSPEAIFLIGADALCERYALALQVLGHQTIQRAPSDVALLGLTHLYNHLKKSSP